MIQDSAAWLRGSILGRTAVRGVVAGSILSLAIPARAVANDADADADRETKALDSTATQWSFQFAYQVMPNYYDDTLDDGTTRKAGMTVYVQLRIVAPIQLKSMTILPRLTFRHYENPQGESGIQPHCSTVRAKAGNDDLQRGHQRSLMLE